MADRENPSAKAKPNPPQSVANGRANGSSTSAGGRTSLPSNKGQSYNRPMYRPQPPAKRRRSRRSCCCYFCCWLALILVVLIILVAIASGVLYLLYLPRRPGFTLSSLRVSKFNISASDQLTSRIEVAVTARNPNRRLIFVYDPISISVTSNGIDLGDGSFPAFIHDTENTTVMRATVSSSVQNMDPSAVTDLKKSSIPLEIDLETKAGVKVDKLKTKKVGIKVFCRGIEIANPKGKKAPPQSTPDAGCKVKLRIKIWKWTF
ncbi:hypothetical protein HPP92_008590 [Vanilla planifolia]|uniref:Late embryogenesis abundant protein LEA-2 subgroup domain-containing protein n=1 Tax=Vanilla planifolia TaxID=51239 RepID=A0A835RDZ3_VANPL|nr:hypothetical protein HPP92_008777 [Vanilla planifolia]KAG0486495.1 hypothetical protein HPP92_008590 [Vanilla planifolia]